MTSPTDPVRRTTARGQATRAALLSATSDLVRDVGYARTTTRAVAAAAGVAEGTLYRHFPDKASLLIAAVMEQSAPTVARMSELASRAGQGTVEGNLTDCLSQLATLRETVLPLELALLTDPELDRHLRQPPPPDMDPALMLADYLAAEQQLGRVRSDASPRSAAFLLLAVLFGLQAAPAGATEHLGAVSVADAVHLFVVGLVPTAPPTGARRTRR